MLAWCCSFIRALLADQDAVVSQVARWRREEAALENCVAKWSVDLIAPRARSYFRRSHPARAGGSHIPKQCIPLRRTFGALFVDLVVMPYA